MRRSVSILVAASLAAGTGFAPAYAAMPSPPAFVGTSANLIPVVDESDSKANYYPKKKRKPGNADRRDYSRDRDRDRHRDRDDDDNDAAAAFALGVIGGLTTGAIVGSRSSYGGSSWATACAQRYRSFDPRSGTYVGYDGRRHPCRL